MLNSLGLKCFRFGIFILIQIVLPAFAIIARCSIFSPGPSLLVLDRLLLLFEDYKLAKLLYCITFLR